MGSAYFKKSASLVEKKQFHQKLWRRGEEGEGMDPLSLLF